MLLAGMLSFYACGPSAEEKAAAEKAKQDSIAAVQKHTDDSLAAVAAAEKAKQDSIANAAAAEKAKADSLAAASSKKKAPAKKTNEQKVKEDKKVLQKQKG